MSRRFSGRTGRLGAGSVGEPSASPGGHAASAFPTVMGGHGSCPPRSCSASPSSPRLLVLGASPTQHLGLHPGHEQQPQPRLHTHTHTPRARRTSRPRKRPTGGGQGTALGLLRPLRLPQLRCHLPRSPSALRVPLRASAGCASALGLQVTCHPILLPRLLPPSDRSPRLGPAGSWGLLISPAPRGAAQRCLQFIDEDLEAQRYYVTSARPDGPVIGVTAGRPLAWESDQPGCKLQLSLILRMWGWTSYTTSLCLSIPTCAAGKQIVASR